ncbi:hypothetical protein CERSUDRAFT_50496 [Gelatoporia subvermispora B]|uniref:Transmembrane protein n=1 Tax=Ceriporiopsis subvermispora (strain B) TaxID=914234 RepID=M2RFP8_CERS8|nr:hypothetical protein CERSUDRAFT_50496 [Gelatoporia subvermispora B]
MNSVEPTRHIVVFAAVGWRALSAVIHLLGVSILTHFFSRRITLQDVSSFSGIRNITWPRLLVLTTFFLSWSFLFSSGVVIGGVGLEYNQASCTLGIVNCIIFYASSKVSIYLFLLEKVHVVWSLNPRAKRFRSPMYVACLTFVCIYGLVAISLMIGAIALLRPDGACVIGLKRGPSITLLVYDLTINILFTALFLWPIYRARFRNARIRRVAVRTTWAAAVALTTSCVNILILTLMNGKQLGWICLTSCGTDVLINAAVLFWVTSGKGSTTNGRPRPPSLSLGDTDRPFVRPMEPPSATTTLTSSAPATPTSATHFCVSDYKSGPHDLPKLDLEAQLDKDSIDIVDVTACERGWRAGYLGHLTHTFGAVRSMLRRPEERPDVDFQVHSYVSSRSLRRC